MNWFQQNRFLGIFLAIVAFATVLSACFLLHERSATKREEARLETVTNELIRLRGSTPFPNEENLRKTREQIGRYRDSLLALKNESKRWMFPKAALQPNEFQAQLRETAIDVSERARARKVQLPENFNLGFEEYATSLPKSAAASRLGRQLRAIEWIANIIIDARVDSLQNLTRTALPEEKATPAPTRARTAGGKGLGIAKAGARIVDSTSIDVAFSGSPAAVRRILNQIAAAREQAYIIRTLQVRNQTDKGPERGSVVKLTPATAMAIRPAPDRCRRKRAGDQFYHRDGASQCLGADRNPVVHFSGNGGPLGDGVAADALRARGCCRRRPFPDFLRRFYFSQCLPFRQEVERPAKRAAAEEHNPGGPDAEDRRSDGTTGEALAVAGPWILRALRSGKAFYRAGWSARDSARYPSPPPRP